jgi:hypothetical protein
MLLDGPDGLSGSPRRPTRFSVKKYSTVQSGLIVAEIAGDSGIRKAASKALGAPQQRVFKEGHRETFPGVIRREGYLYVINRAISSRTNENYDTWPAEEIASTAPGLGYLTFVGKPIFVEHANDNHRRTRGVNIAAALHEDFNPDGSPDTWVSVLKEVDPVKFPKLSRAILAGRVNRTSMGADVGESICSKCANVATSPAEYCGHIPTAKGAIFEDLDGKTGAKRHGLVSEVCRKIAFFEDTFIVTTPADPTAHVLVVEGAENVPEPEPVRPHMTLLPFTSNLHLATATATTGGDPEDEEDEGGLSDYTAAKELTLPPRIDTLQNTTCPVCGSENSFSGNRCSVCNSVKPPDALMDPDTSVAPQIQDWIEDNLDPAEDVDDLEPGPDLQCPECGSQFTSQFKDEAQGNPYLVPAANQEEPADETLGEEAQELGLAQDDEEAEEGEGDEDDDPDADMQIGGPEKPPVKDVDDLTNEQDESDFAPDDGDATQAPVEDEEDAEAEQQGLDDSEAPEGQEDPEEALAESEDEDAAGLAEGGYSAGDVCPACGKGVLEPLEDDGEEEGSISAASAIPAEGEEEDLEEGDPEDGEENPAGDAPGSETDSSSADDEDGEDENEDDDEPPPFAKKKPKSAALASGRNTSTMPTRRTPTTGRVTPKGTPAKPANPAGLQRTALMEALEVHAQRQEEDHAAIARVAALVQAHDQILTKAKEIINNQASFIRRQAAVIDALSVRNGTLEAQMAHLAKASPREHQEALVALGREGYAKVAAIYRQANPANPAQPIMEPNPEAPVVTEQQAMQPSARDDVTQLGATPMTDVSADATVSVDQPYGEIANAPVGMNRVDVTAPVDGTQYMRPPSETIIPVDVRVGNPDNPQPAFPWTMGPVGGNGPQISGPSVGNPPATANKRAFATLHLAKLQIAAGIASGDDLEIAASLDASPMTDSDIQGQISTLSKVVEANGRRVQGSVSELSPTVGNEPTRRLVPKAAAFDGGAKSVPSFQIPTQSVSGPNPDAPRGVSVGSVSSDELAFE